MKYLILKIVSLILMLSVTLSAGSFSIMPLGVNLSAQNKTDMLIVRNTSDKAMIIQLNLVSWEQKDGKNYYAPTDALLAVPSIFTIKPGAVQNIRIGLRKMELNGSEQAYRLYLREISSKDDVSKGKVQVLLRVGIPVFVKTRDKNTPIIQWNVTCDRDHHLMLSAHNTGNVHLKVIEIALSDASQKKLFVKKMSHYILSGTKRSWSFEIDACPKIGTKFKLSALTNVGRIDANPVAQ